MRVRPIVTWIATATAAALLPAACTDDESLDDDLYGRVVYDVFPDTARGAPTDPSNPDDPYREFRLTGLARLGVDTVEYADLGDVYPEVLPEVYVMTRGGRPVEGQYPIVDTLPDKAEYSPYWRVVEVEVPSAYVPNATKSKGGIERNGFRTRVTDRLIYCPVVNPDAYWITQDPDFGDLYWNVFYGTGEPVPNPYFDPGAPDAGSPDEAVPPVLTDTAATEADIRLTPFWHKRLLGFCLPGVLDAHREATYTVEAVQDDPACDPSAGACPTHPELAGAHVNMLFELYQPLETTGGEYIPWGEPGLLAAGPGDEGYSSATLIAAVFTADPALIGTTDDIDLEAVELLALRDLPITRVIPAPATEGGEDATDGEPTE
jgi:hypothetical protein